MENERFGRDVFLALAAIGWADGHLDAEEADAIVKMALEEGLEIKEIEEIERATKTRVGLDTIDRSKMTKADRLFVYAVAAWMTRLDGKTDDAEVDALDELGRILRIPPVPRGHADDIAREIAELGGDESVLGFDLKKLRETIISRLAEAQRLKKLNIETDVD